MSLLIATCLLSQATSSETCPQWGGSDGTFVVQSLEPLLKGELKTSWTAEVGSGESAVVADARHVFTFTLLKQDAEFKDEKELFERVVAVNRETGKVAWSKQYRVEKRKDQESFGASKRSPKATPALSKNRLVTLGFTGKLKCWSTTDGSLKWEHDLIADYGASAVQFGFSASPVPTSDGDVLVLIGGEKGGLTKFNAETGEPVWTTPLDNASYATPVLCKLAGEPQILAHSQNRIVGIGASDGRQLWEWSLPKSGLTNVPTPIVLPGNRIMVSGQGVEGTACLRVGRDNDKWKASQQWLTKRVQFFYCNWMSRGDVVLGCNDKLMFAFDSKTGSVSGRWRGYGEANLVADKQTVLVLHGDGKLSVLKQNGGTLKLVTRYQAVKGRCWTAPTVVRDQMFVRSGTKLHCISSQGTGAKLATLEIRDEQYDIATGGDSERDYVSEIVAEFEKSGPQAAFKLYQDLQKKAGKAFTAEQRIALADLAAEQKLTDFRTLILRDAAGVFPESEVIKEAPGR